MIPQSIANNHIVWPWWSLNIPPNPASRGFPFATPSSLVYEVLRRVSEV